MTIKTLHVADDRGELENVFNLPQSRLRERTVIKLDLGKDGLANKPSHRNPQLCKSEKTGRGPLTGNWQDGSPMMCAYKLLDFTLDSYILWAASGHFCNVHNADAFIMVVCEGFDVGVQSICFLSVGQVAWTVSRRHSEIGGRVPGRRRPDRLRNASRGTGTHSHLHPFRVKKLVLFKWCWQ